MNNAMPFRIIAAFTLVFATLVPHASGEDEDGLFADFETSLGDFTARLEFEKVPRTVANFVGLAEGSRPWVHSQTGAVHENDPFYTGIIFHRVIEGFMSQTGSRKGDGTDGPGYTFRDEFDPTLRHDGPYVLSMANSGPNSNGSQFFITAADTSDLDDLHSVFGLVTSGQAVVDAINQVATTNNDRPLQDVVIQSVTIRRVGAAAEAFDVHVWDLPIVGVAVGDFQVTVNPQAPPDPPNAAIASDVGLIPRTTIQVYSGLGLGDMGFFGQLYWSAASAADSGINFQVPLREREFYRMLRVEYPDARDPESLQNAVFEFTFNGVVIHHEMDATGQAGQSLVEFPGSGNPSIEAAYEVFDSAAQPHAFSLGLVDNNLSYPYFGLWFVMHLDHEDGNVTSGRLRTDTFHPPSQSWQTFGSGTFTMILPEQPDPDPED